MLRVLAVVALVLVVHELYQLARVIRVRWHDPAWTSMMQERDEALEGGLTVEQTWRPLDQISTKLVRAVIAAEDIHFADHMGIDVDAILEARQANAEVGRVVQGGSTITQQLAKNLFLSSRQSYVRKAREAIFAVELELCLPKRRIMELYLNVIEWGDGIYGAEAAAQHYFDKPAADLSGFQAAYLAAIIPGPRSAMNPRKHPGRHKQARTRIQRAMRLVPANPL